MLIECITKRDSHTEMNLRGVRYLFSKNEHGHYVCPVLVGGDREYLLALKDDFRLYEPPKEEVPQNLDTQMIELSEQGKKPREIAEILGLTPQKVGLALKRLRR
jgi:hypothetical protein